MLDLNKLKNYYLNSPLWIKKIYSAIPFEWRNGKEYRSWFHTLSTSLNEPEYEILKLKETIFFAYSEVPYYKNLFDSMRIKPEDINSLSDYQEVPLLDKVKVTENYDSLIAKNIKKSNMFYVTTGGTSGKPLKFYQSSNVWRKELAFQVKLFSKYGYHPKYIMASLRGGEFSNLGENIFWKESPIRNEIHFSPFHLTTESVHHYVNKLNYVKPLFFMGYFSSYKNLLNCMRDQSLKLSYNPKLFIFISENFEPRDVKEITDYYNCSAVSYYGHSERLVFAPSSDNLDSYFIDRKYGLAEIVDKNYCRIEKNNQVGEIIGTSYDNYAMPLLRYKTDDHSSYINYENRQIDLIQGRWINEFIEGRNGEKLSIAALNMHSDIFKNVIAYQYKQFDKGHATIVIVPNSEFNHQDGEIIIQAFNEKAGHAINFSIELRDKLYLTERGKIKPIIKKI